MTDPEPSPVERRILELMESLKQSGQVTCGDERVGPIVPPADDSAAAFALLENFSKVTLDKSLAEHHIRNRELGLHWYTDSSIGAGGEFILRELVEAVMSGPPNSDAVYDEHDRELFGHLRVVDYQPYGGSGSFSAIRLVDGSVAPHMWTYDIGHGAAELELDYPGYLDALLVTKGFYGWQYLYTDIRLDDHPSLANLLRTNLAFLTGSMPGPDYSDLETRLAERLS